MMVMIIGTMRVPPENIELARSALTDLISATRQEPGCLDYSFSEHVGESGVFQLVERWADRAALETHWQSPTLKSFGPMAEKLGVSDRNMILFEIASHTKL